MRLGNVEGDYNRYLLFPLWYLCQKKKKNAARKVLYTFKTLLLDQLGTSESQTNAVLPCV